MLALIGLSGSSGLEAKEAPGRIETFVANEVWQAIDWQPMKIAKGSALDFSNRRAAPAGKSGEVICRDGRFVFKDQPDKEVRFYGINVTHALPYLEKERTEQLADYLAASGYNLVRFHNYNFPECSLIKGPGSTEFNETRLDQFDYLLKCLKDRGLYYVFPLNSWSGFKPGDAADVEEFANRKFRFESNGLLPISNKVLGWLKDFSRNFLNHKNAYTGVVLKDDPALIGAELTNENALFAVMGHHPEFVEIYRKKVRVLLQDELKREPTESEVAERLPVYVLGLQEQFYQTMKGFLRQMEFNKPLTDVNHRSNLAYALVRAQMDYVDIHGYWDLYKTPEGVKISDPGEPPYRIKGVNPNLKEWNPVPAQLAAGRIFGLPFASSEFSSNYPSPYWCYTGPGEAMLAGLQGWSSIIRYAQMPFPAKAFKVSPIVRVESGGSPLVMFSERIASMLYLGGEVSPLGVKIPLAITPEYILSKLNESGGASPPDSYCRLAFDYQLGTVLLDGKESLEGFPCLVVPPDMKLPQSLKDKKVFRAKTGLAEEIKGYLAASPAPASPWKADTQIGSAQIVTSQSETFLMPAEQTEAEGKSFGIKGNKGISVCFAGSVDQAPLTQSQRILVMYLTDLRNSGTEIVHDAEGGMTVTKYGSLPLLIRQGTVTMTFKIPGRSKPKAWALKYDGSRAVPIAVSQTADGFSFEAKAVTAPDTFAAYEVAWE